jgi:trans-aconitate 2-methyltransferase
VEPEKTTSWDATQYARFKEERSRPFLDLLARVRDHAVARAADLGCGTGEMTRHLLERWPEAEVWGVDSSPEMLARARAAPAPPGLHFVQEDLRVWRPPAPLDLLFSNAALQWVPDHEALLDCLAGMLASGGVLAVQMPNNRDEAACRILESLLEEPDWARHLPPELPRPRIESVRFYERRLRAMGFFLEIWETTYHHRLASAAEIVEWFKGTTLRPVLSTLSGADAGELLSALTSRIEEAYPSDPRGVIFPFRRLFFIARRPG